MNVLGIDMGGKYVGLALVRQPDNEVLYASTIELRDLRDTIKDRRAMRRIRRQQIRYRKPKEPTRGGGSVGRGGGLAPPYRRATGMNRLLHTKCKFVDKATGEVCNKNTPMKSNVKPLLLWNVVRWLPIPDEERQEIMSYVDNKTKSPQPLKTLLKSLKIDTYSKKQIRDITNNKQNGRAVFCREHIPHYESQADVEKESRWLAPSVLQKRLDVMQTIKDISSKHTIDKVVIEHANFDLQKIQRGETLEPDEYQKGPRFMFRNTYEALKQEYSNRCCYCGKRGGEAKLNVEHIMPKGRGGGDTWDNLSLACEDCNHKKGNRTPEEVGMKFFTYRQKRGELSVNVSQRPKLLGESRINKYMTQTDIGIRYFERLIKDMLCNDIPIERCHGYQTAYYRNKWKLDKEHSNDAAVIASTKPPKPDTNNAPRFVTESETIKLQVKGKQLFDMNPLQKRNSTFYQRVQILEEKGGLKMNQIPRIVDPHKRKVLEKLRDKYGIRDKKTFEEGHLHEIPFKGVVIKRLDAGESNTRRLKNNLYKATEANVALVVYKNTDGIMKYFVKKNPLAYKNICSVPEDYEKFVQSFKKGEKAAYENKGGVFDGKIVRITSRGGLCLENNDGNKKEYVATRCSKVE